MHYGPAVFINKSKMEEILDEACKKKHLSSVERGFLRQVLVKERSGHSAKLSPKQFKWLCHIAGVKVHESMYQIELVKRRG